LAFAYPLASLRAVYGGPWLGIVVRAAALSLGYAVLFGVATLGLLVAAILLR
jgi:hypothetical protein